MLEITEAEAKSSAEAPIPTNDEFSPNQVKIKINNSVGNEMTSMDPGFDPITS